VKHGLFITGTGTGVGKTLVTAGIVRYLLRRGVDAVPMKPVQTGGIPNLAGILAPDLEFSLAAAEISLAPHELELAAPYIYEPACSPHLAGRIERRYPEIPRIARCARALLERHQAVATEGAGGVLVPLDENHTMLDLMKELGFPVVLVAHDGLGTINHTLLSLQALRGAGLEVLGVVFNALEPPSPEDEYIREDNPKTIARLSGVRILGQIPYLEGIAPDRAGLWERFETHTPGLETILERIRRP
jgi:dethiobiotin synthase